MSEPSTGYLAAIVIIASVITFALRATGFVILGRIKSDRLVNYLGKVLPAGIMAVLVVYLVRDVPSQDAISVSATLVGMCVTAAVHLWRRQALLSIVAGTLVYALFLMW